MIKRNIFYLLIFSCCHFVGVAQQTSDTTPVKPSTKDTSHSVLKSTLKRAYQQIDKIPLTHKYINKADSLKNVIVNSYKKIDSSIVNDTSKTIKAALLKQIIPGNKDSKLKNKLEPELPIALAKADSTPSIKLNPQLNEVLVNSPQESAAFSYIKAGTSYLQQNEPKEAILNYEKGLHIAQQINKLEIVELALKGLSDAYVLKADGKNALLFYKQYIATKDSLVQIKTDKIIGELNAKYEDEKKQREIQSLLVDGEKKKVELNETKGIVKEQKQLILLIVIILFLITILTITFFRQYRIKKKNNELLISRNKIILEQRDELENNLTYTKGLQALLKEDLERYMQMALRKQMNPHFIFNALNSIQSFILQNDKLSANLYLSKFSSLMRKVLENSQHHFIPLAKEIEVLKLYVELEEQRFDNEFKCVWSIDEAVDAATDKIPPLLLQPYIENAIWHGLLHKDGERLLIINISKNEEQLICVIEDNGIGRPAALELSKSKKHHESLGIKITQKRIDLINSFNQSGIGVIYHDLQDYTGVSLGTKVEVTIPYVGL